MNLFHFVLILLILLLQELLLLLLELSELDLALLVLHRLAIDGVHNRLLSILLRQVGLHKSHIDFVKVLD